MSIKVDNKKTTLFVMGKYIEDIREDEKHVQDLLEAIMRPNFFIKEKLRRILMKTDQLGPKIIKIRISTFWIPEIRHFPPGGQCQPAR